MLKDRQELRAFREECVRAYNAYKRKILVCAGTGCVSSDSLNIYARLRELIEANGIHCAVELEHEPESEGVALKKSGCNGFCESGPLVRIEPEGWLYTKVKVEDCEEIVEKTIVNGEHIERLAFQKNGEIYKTGHNGCAVINHGFHSQVVAPGYAMCYAWGIRHLEGDPWLKTRIDDKEHEWLWKPDANDHIYPNH